MSFDPITLEVLRNALQSAAEEMGAALTRTALSPNIKDRRDCSTAIYTREGLLVAQAEHIPLHLGLMPAVVKAVLREYPLELLSEGDAVIINDPYISGSHLPDICVISPVYHAGEPLALVANLAHHVDVGGAVPGSMSTTSREIFQEGIRIPPVKIRSGGQLNHELMKVLSTNVRTAREFYGDIHAQIAANNAGEKRLRELAGRYGAGMLRQYMEEIINYAERRMRSALAGLPRGTYTFEDYLEGDGLSSDLIKIKAAVKTGGDSILVDFTGTAPQAVGPVNATRGVTLACVYFAVKAVTDPELPSSEGMARPIEVVTPAGTLVSPRYPAPVVHANINTAQRITDVILGALAQAVPERVTAAGTGSMSNFTIGGLHPETGVYYSYVETYGGGQGAKCGQDGMDGVHVNMTNTRNTPVEVIEISYPLLVNRYGLIPNSGGAGRWRGGLGMVREVTVLGQGTAFSVSTERNVLCPWGLAGGGQGRRAGCYLKNDGEGTSLPGKITGDAQAFSAVGLETAGGGGYGEPLDRDPALVLEDVLDGLVSRKEAREKYGVRFIESEERAVDYTATQSLRERLRQSMRGVL
jgi:N-methylhydantoinase B